MDEVETTRLKLGDVNKNLICGLCDGYLIDATTIIECLHSFCRTCIVTFLKTSKSCPKCETLVHKTRPHQNLRSDKLLQDLVYKIVPGLYKDEMRRRREFYTIHYEDAPKLYSEDRGDEMSDRFVFTNEELVSLALHYCPNNNNERSSFHRIFKTKEEFKSRHDRKAKDSIYVRYFQCKAAVCVRHLKKLIRLKYDLPPNYQIDMFYNEEPLRDNYSLADVALSFNWRRKSAMRLFFCIYEMTVQKVAIGQEIPKLTHSTGLNWQPPRSEDLIASTVTTTTTTTTSSSSPLSPVSTFVPAEVKVETPIPMEVTPQTEITFPSTSTCEVSTQPSEKTDTSQKTESDSSSLKENLIKPKVKTKSGQVSSKHPHKVKGHKSSNRQSILGKRSATTPVLIAPAPAKKANIETGQPILRMAKMIKLGSTVPTSKPIPQTSHSTSNKNTTAMSFIPVTISSVLPASQTGQCHPAFVNGYLQSISNTHSSGPSAIRIVPGIATPAPNSQTIISPLSPLPTLKLSGKSQCISKTMSSLSLTSPPGCHIGTTIPAVSTSVALPHPPIPAFPLSSVTPSTLSASSYAFASSLKTTSSLSTATSTTTQTVTVTSAVSPTPAASASPTPAAVPSQQSQTQGTDSQQKLVSSSSDFTFKSTSSKNNAPMSIPHANNPTTTISSCLVKGSLNPQVTCNPPALVSNLPVLPLSSIKLESNQKNSSSSTEQKTPVKNPALPHQSSTTLSQSSSLSPTTTSSPSLSPSSSSPKTAARKSCKQKTIADIANTLHQRMSASLIGQNQNSIETNASFTNVKTKQQPSPQQQNQQIQQQRQQQQQQQHQQHQQQIQQQQLKQHLHHKQQPQQINSPVLLSTSQIANNGFAIKKEIGVGLMPTMVKSCNPPGTVQLGGMAIAHPALHLPPPLFLGHHAAASLMQLHHHQQQQQLNHLHHHQHNHHPSSMGGQGRMEEPLNLVTRDKDFHIATSTPPIVRHKFPPIVK